MSRGDSEDKRWSDFIDAGAAMPDLEQKMELKISLHAKAAKKYERVFGDKLSFSQLEKDVVDRHVFTPKNNNGKRKIYFDYLNSLKDKDIPLDPKQTSFHEKYSREKEERDRVYDAQIAKESDPKKQLQIAVAKEYAQYSDKKGNEWTFADLEQEVEKAKREDKGVKNIRLKRAIYQSYLDRLRGREIKATEKEIEIDTTMGVRSVFRDHIAQVSVSGALSPPPKVVNQTKKEGRSSQQK